MEKKDKKEVQEVENYLEKNIEFLMKNDISRYIHDTNSLISEMISLYFDLFDALVVDDSVIFELHKGETLDYKKVEEAESIVKKFDSSNRFLTLTEKHYDALEKVLGKEMLELKISSVKKDKWNNRNKEWK